MKNLKKIDAENDDFFKQSKDNVVSGKWSIEDIVGFKLKEPTVFLPRVSCAHLAPSVASICKFAGEKTATSILTLLPLYDSLVYPISPNFGDTKMSEENFEEANEISLMDFLKIVERGRIIPYFVSRYQVYDVSFLQHFLEIGIPRISNRHMDLIRAQNSCGFTNEDCEKCEANSRSAQKDLANFLKKGTISEDNKSCANCLANAYSMGIEKDRIFQSHSPRQTLCAISDIRISRNMGGVFQTNCPICVETLRLFTGVTEIENAVEAIVDGLRVKYTRDLDFEGYLELLDEKTTRAIREITKKILEDPFATKYSERLNAKIFSFNREVEEVAKTRTAKFYHAISDIAVYGGNKFVERQTQGYLQAGKKDVSKVSRWIASKLMDYHAKVMGKDWTVAQLYRTQCKIEQCKVPSEPEK